MELKHRIRALWCNSNSAERKLWQALQNPQLFSLPNSPNNEHDCLQERAQQSVQQSAQQSITMHDASKKPKFARHVAVGDFIVDFLCADLKLVIELDGGLSASEKARDLQRTTVLQYKGFLVVRLFQREILDNLPVVLDGLKLVMCKRQECQLREWQLRAGSVQNNPQQSILLKNKEGVTWI